MLERTAGCLEKGSLRRLLRASTSTSIRPLRNRRTLHSGFWSHGAVDAELPSLWSALVQAMPMDAENKPATTSKGILLDFLYPAGSINFLRKYSNWGGERQERRCARSALEKLGQRQYTDSARNREPAGQDHPNLEAEDLGDPHGTEAVELLNQSLGLTEIHNYEENWRQFQLRDHDTQVALRPRMLEYLSTSTRELDANRSRRLFMAMSSQNHEAYQHLIRAYLNVHKVQEAITLQKDAAEKFDHPIGTAELLAYFLASSSWSEAIAIWREAAEIHQRQPRLSYDIYAAVHVHPQSGTVICNLAEYISETLAEDTESDHSELLDFAKRIFHDALLHWKSYHPAHIDFFLDHLSTWGTSMESICKEAIHALRYHDESFLVTRWYQYLRKRYDHMVEKDILYDVLRIYCKHDNIAGVQEIIDHFFKFYGRPTRRAYQICLVAFSQRGDAATVMAIFEQYIQRFEDTKYGLKADHLYPVLAVYARRGEVAQVIDWFGKLREVYNIEPDIACYNILLSSYTKVHNVDKAYELFDEILASPTLAPDDYTFGTMMGMCTTRGDTKRVLELYRLAEYIGIEMSSAMIDCVVLSLAQDGKLARAEELCKSFVGVDLKGNDYTITQDGVQKGLSNKTRMWNYLLNAYALKRDLLKVNEILQEMSQADVKYDADTYSNLMQALAMVKQPENAVRILRFVLPEAGIVATSFHYAIVMGGFLATGRPGLVFHLQKLMAAGNVTEDASTNYLVFKATASAERTLVEEGTGEETYEAAVEVFRQLLRTFDPKDISNTTRKGMGLLPLNIAYPTMLYNYLMKLFAYRSEHESVEQLFNEFLDLLPEEQRERVPISILSALMISKLGENDFAGVQSCWDLALARLLDDGRGLPPLKAVMQMEKEDSTEEPEPTEARRVVPKYQLALMRPLTVQLESLFLQRKINEMIELIDYLLAQGYYIDSVNWNRYIEFLVRSSRYKLAFKLCETKLINQWYGWAALRWEEKARNTIPLAFRRMRKDVKFLRPHHQLFLRLAKAFLDLESYAAESTASQKIIDEIEKYCPKTVKAIKTLPRSNNELERMVMEEDY